MFYKPSKRISKEAVGQILALKEVIEPEIGFVNSGGGDTLNNVVQDTLRETEIRWISRDLGGNLFDFAEQMAAEYGPKLNVFEKMTVVGAIQLGTYHPGHFYGWHVDDEPRHPDARVMTTSILLSDDFTGGRLEFKTPGAPKLKKVGELVLFNTDEEHRVQPVRTGVRDSLVIWWGRHA